MSEQRPSPDQIALGRLRKRLEKVTRQRDSLKQMCTHYREVLDLHPMAEYRYRSFTEARAERQRVKDLEQRCREQALLIQTFQKERL